VVADASINDLRQSQARIAEDRLNNAGNPSHFAMGLF
jgi:hypothetical protein